MKNVFILLSFLITGYFAGAQTIPNSSFESWEANILPAYEEPSPWNTPNPYTSLLGQTSVTKSEDAFDGDYSAQLVTKEISLGANKYYVPGLVTFANFEINITDGSYTFSGGVFMNDKVSRLKGKYKYKPAENDSASVLIYCYRHPEGEDIDTIGVGLAFLHEAMEWTDFSVDMQFFNANIPDTFNVLLMSTGTFQLGYMPPGSILQVDNLSIDTTMSAIPSHQAFATKHYPNPTSDNLTIEMEKDGNGKIIKIFDIQGRLVNEDTFDGNVYRMNVSKYRKGIYTYQIIAGKNAISTASFVIN